MLAMFTWHHGRMSLTRSSGHRTAAESPVRMVQSGVWSSLQAGRATVLISLERDAAVGTTDILARAVFRQYPDLVVDHLSPIISSLYRGQDGNCRECNQSQVHVPVLDSKLFSKSWCRIHVFSRVIPQGKSSDVLAFCVRLLLLPIACDLESA